MNKIKKYSVQKLGDITEKNKEQTFYLNSSYINYKKEIIDE
jgi:hypothetical protein